MFPHVLKEGCSGGFGRRSRRPVAMKIILVMKVEVI
jgi:hypothetical protein